MKKEGREREEGGLLGASSYIIKQTNTHTLTKAYNTGLTLQEQAGIHTTAGDYIHINSRKIEVWLLIKNIYICQ